MNYIVVYTDSYGTERRSLWLNSSVEVTHSNVLIIKDQEDSVVAIYNDWDRVEHDV